MVEDTIIELNNGVRVTLSPISLEFVDELEKFFEERGVPKDKIGGYLLALVRRDPEYGSKR